MSRLVSFSLSDEVEPIMRNLPLELSDQVRLKTAFSATQLARVLKFWAQQPWALYEPHHEKTCLLVFWPGKTQTGLHSYRD